MSPRRLILRFCIILLLAATLIGAGPRRAFSGAIGPGGVITVDSFLDIDDNAPNSVCSAGDPTEGPCTLRAAIYEANQNVLYQDIIIKLPAGVYNLTIPHSFPDDTHSGDLDIAAFNPLNMHSITIEPLSGGPVVIKSTIEDRILSVGVNAKVFINNLTMRDGRVLIDSNNTYGGGAIHNSGTLTLVGVRLLNNSVSCSTSSTCTNAYPIGGAILNLGTLSLTDSTLDGNIADRGSAIFNTATANGNLTILSSTISNNQNRSTATITNYSSLTIINSTFSGNSSSNPSSTAATGITNYKTLSMQSSTMANKGWIGAFLNTVDSTVKIQDNIFKAESGYANCLLLGGTLTSGGYNIASDNSCQLTAEGDQMNTDPQLGSFDYWGGQTKTHMLNPGSPAINHRTGPCQTIVFTISDDQRHRLRDDGNCDTGAFEYHVLTYVGATKVWMPSDLPETLKVGVSFQLYRTTSAKPLPEEVDGPVAVTSGSGWQASWTNKPVTDLQGNPCTYFVREVSIPEKFIAEDVDDLTVTNTYHALLFLPLISK